MTGTIFKFISFHKKKKNIENEHPFFFYFSQYYFQSNTIYKQCLAIGQITGTLTTVYFR